MLQCRTSLVTKSKQLSQQRISAIASDAASNVVSTGATDAHRHNTKTIAAAIKTALREQQQRK